MIAVVTHLRRQIECTTQTGLASLEQELKPLIGVGCTTEAGVLAHRPQTIAVHGWVNASGVRRLSWVADLGCRASNRLGRIQRFNNDSRVCLARGLRIGHGYRLRDSLQGTQTGQSNYGSSYSWLALAHGNHRKHKED